MHGRARNTKRLQAHGLKGRFVAQHFAKLLRIPAGDISLHHALLRRGAQQFSVRAVVRDASSAKAKALAKQGVEVVSANYDDPASLQKAFDGAWGAFCITNYWRACLLPTPASHRCCCC